MAQNPPSSCCTIDPDIVPQSYKVNWCSTNIETCTKVCGEQGEIASGGNSCDATTLEYTCKCGDGTEPDLSLYANTIPSLECQQWQNNCLSTSPKDQWDQCRSTKCGDKVAGSGDSASAATPSTTERQSNTSSPSRTSDSNSGTVSPIPTARQSESVSTTVSSTGSAISTNPQNTNDPNINGGTLSVGKSSTGGGLPPGTLAGIVVGAVVGGLVIIGFFALLRRRSKKAKRKLSEKEFREPYKPSDEKQVAIPIASEISDKAELGNEPGGGGSDLPEVVGYQTTPTYQYPDPGYWQHFPAVPLELHSSEQVAELHASPRSQEMDAEVVSYPLSAAQTLVSAQTSDGGPTSPAAALPALPQSPASTARSMHPLSSEDITALEEEERRLDEEMAEVQRLKELREQKFAIQQKLRDAKRQ